MSTNEEQVNDEFLEARRLLLEALAILDQRGPAIAAIHVCWAIDLIDSTEPASPVLSTRGRP